MFILDPTLKPRFGQTHIIMPTIYFSQENINFPCAVTEEMRLQIEERLKPDETPESDEELSPDLFSEALA